ncbi:kinase-like domain-containing protein [Hypomontagnella monticulosa]|nr:kinase-like domain-containing protein [Hypomontagnella monticulosa]
MSGSNNNSIVFYLVPQNPRAREATAQNSRGEWKTHFLWAFDTSVETKDPNKLLTLGTIGSDPSKADFYIPGDDIQDVHCAFMDRSFGRTKLCRLGETRNYLHATSSILRFRAAVPCIPHLPNCPFELHLGDDIRGTAYFRFWWKHQDPEITLSAISNRISAASGYIRQRDLITFPGQKLMHYGPDPGITLHTICELGSGAYGRVEKAVDVYSGDIIAVKRLVRSPKLGDSDYDEYWERVKIKSWYREVTLLSHLTHSYIVPCLGSQGWEFSLDKTPMLSEGPGKLEIFMPLMKGCLYEVIKPDLPAWNERISHDILIHMLSALDYLDRLKIIHRDLKPNNILFDIDQWGNHIFKLADFGLADREPFAEGYRLGTFPFIAPEIQAEDEIVVPQSTKADVWSLYITMLWVLDIRGFYKKLESDSPWQYNEVIRLALEAAQSEAKIFPMRNMAIYDPVHRASAGEMLVMYGRSELLALPQELWRAPRDRFQSWLDEVMRGGSSPYSYYIMATFEPSLKKFGLR